MAGVTTRPVTLPSGEVVRFTREALEGMAEQVKSASFIPITAEHLSFMPPIGNMDDAEVIILADGHFELIVTGEFLEASI
jgi:hypothetical protein